MGLNISYLINKLLGVQIKGSDVTLPTQIKGSDVNLPVQLTGSNIALPVDIQYNNLPDTNPIPIKHIGKNIKETKIAATLSVNPSSAAIIGSFDVSDAEYYAVAVIADVSHSFVVTGQRRSSVDDYFDEGLSKRDQILANAARAREISAEFRVKSSKVAIQIDNNDAAAAHTYSVWLFKMGGKLV